MFVCSTTFIMDSSNDESKDGILMIPIMMSALLATMPVNATLSMQDLLSLKSRRARQGKIRQQALQDPARSAFWILFNSKQDDALIALCGFDHAAFSDLLVVFQDLFCSYRPLKKGGLIKKVKPTSVGQGQPRLLNPTSCLALYLAWTKEHRAN